MTRELHRYIKIGSAGEQLPCDAASWVAVLDTTTGLMWSVEESRYMSQPQCVEYAAQMTAGGFSDWQLPTRAQLLTLVDDTRYSPAIATEFFPDCKSDWYWTQTPTASSPSDYAWYVSFDRGNAFWGLQVGGGGVRAVRVGQGI